MRPSCGLLLYGRRPAAGGLYVAGGTNATAIRGEATCAGRRRCCSARSYCCGQSLRDLDAIVPKLRQLGARHVAYGAQPAHYPVVGSALIAAMAAVAGADWKEEYEAAWAEAFDVVATT